MAVVFSQKALFSGFPWIQWVKVVKLLSFCILKTARKYSCSYHGQFSYIFCHAALHVYHTYFLLTYFCMISVGPSHKKIWKFTKIYECSQNLWMLTAVSIHNKMWEFTPPYKQIVFPNQTFLYLCVSNNIFVLNFNMFDDCWHLNIITFWNQIVFWEEFIIKTCLVVKRSFVHFVCACDQARIAPLMEWVCSTKTCTPHNSAHHNT